jgi:putative addiction module killer protein
VKVSEYRLPNGRSPFRDWFDRLETADKIRVDARIGRFREGNLGDHRSVAKGVYEARLHFGPGYRIYFGREGSALILLLAGGDKSSQKRDILRARWLWIGYRKEKEDGSTPHELG